MPDEKGKREINNGQERERERARERERERESSKAYNENDK